jgi:DNA-binding transcriptional MerR regulator
MYMKIQQIETLSGLDRATIRYYEKEGLLNPHRTENGYRDYSDADLEELKKIKLLRQLGMPLDSIRKLQQGREDFLSAMDEQIDSLRTHITERQWAMEVCREIRNENRDYRMLQADRYLELLRRPQYEPEQSLTKPETPKPPEPFREKIRREVHPWRRFFARNTDRLLFIAIVNYVLFVVLRVRMMPDWFGILFGYTSYWVVILLEPFWLHYIGTTPGKWIFGIKLEYCQGGKLPIDVAFDRCGKVLQLGQGYGIPGWQLYRLYKSNTELVEQYQTPWDSETEVTYTKFDWKKKALVVLTAGLILFMFASSVVDMMLPQHRGDLTIQEFSENYRFYHEKVMKSQTDLLNADGTWVDQADHYIGAVIYADGNGDHETADFTYELKNGAIRSIRFEDEWIGFHTAYTLPDYLIHAAMSYVAAQPGMTAKEVTQWSAMMDQALMNRSNDSFTVEFHGIRIHWEIEYENCDFGPYGWLYATNEVNIMTRKTDARMRLIFIIEQMN